MNRAIKFRAWNGEQMLTRDDKGRLVIDIETGEVQKVHYGDTPFNLTLPKGLVLMQYTGLKDKNGVEIYEGDVVKVFDEGVHTIVYGAERDEYPAFELEPDPAIDCNALQNAVVNGECEVIGNKYENPELLGGNQS